MRKLTLHRDRAAGGGRRHHGRRRRPGAARARRGRARSAPASFRSSCTRTTSTTAFIRMPLPAGDEKYGRIDGAQPEAVRQRDHRDLAQSRDDGELMWGRIAGTKYDDMVEALVESKFKEFGLAGRPAPVLRPAAAVVPDRWKVSASGGGKTLTFKTLQAGARRDRHAQGGARPRRRVGRTRRPKPTSPAATSRASWS